MSMTLSCISDLPILDVWTSENIPKPTAYSLEFMRSLSPAEKWEHVGALNATVRAMLIDTLRRRHPDADEQEIRHRLCAVLYGAELATKAHGPLPAPGIEDELRIPNLEVWGPCELIKRHP